MNFCLIARLQAHRLSITILRLSVSEPHTSKVVLPHQVASNLPHRISTPMKAKKDNRSLSKVAKAFRTSKTTAFRKLKAEKEIQRPISAARPVPSTSTSAPRASASPFHSLLGLEGAKAEMKTALNSKEPLLLLGPPGCGKTALVTAAVEESQATLITVNPSDMGDPKAIREAFKKATKHDHAIIFLDEADVLLHDREKGLPGFRQAQMELLICLQQTSSLVIMASNMKGGMDRAVLRRIGHVARVNTPNQEERVALLQKFLVSIHKNDLQAVARHMDDFSSSEVLLVAKKASSKGKNGQASLIELYDAALHLARKRELMFMA